MRKHTSWIWVFLAFKPRRNRSTLWEKIQKSIFFGKKKMQAAPFLTPVKTKILVLLSASDERFGVSRMWDFFSGDPKKNCKAQLIYTCTLAGVVLSRSSMGSENRPL